MVLVSLLQASHVEKHLLNTDAMLLFKYKLGMTQ